MKNFLQLLGLLGLFYALFMGALVWYDCKGQHVDFWGAAMKGGHP